MSWYEGEAESEGRGKKESVHSDSFQQLHGNQFPECCVWGGNRGAGMHKAPANIAVDILVFQQLSVSYHGLPQEQGAYIE